MDLLRLPANIQKELVYREQRQAGQQLDVMAYFHYFHLDCLRSRHTVRLSQSIYKPERAALLDIRQHSVDRLSSSCCNLDTQLHHLH